MNDYFSSTSLWEVLGWTMLHFLWMGCIALAVAAAVRGCVRRWSAKFRYFASLLCLFGVTASAVAALSVSLRQVSGRVADATGSALPTAEPTAAEAPPLPVDWMQPGSRSQRPAAQPQPDVRLPTAQEAFRQWVLDGTLNVIAGLLPWLWVCGTPLVVLALLTGIIGTTRLRRRSTAVSDEQLQGQLRRLRTLLGISRRVGLAVCDQVSSPLVIGILRPLIVLPPAMISGLAPVQLEMILLHELAHVRRWDNLVNLLQRTVEALLFYHPAVWWASRWVRLEREHCCDALVLAHNHTPQSYAETLAALALPELAPQFATAAMANHQLTSRICHILNVEERTMTISMRTLIGGIVLLAAGVGGFLLATFRTEPIVAADDPVPATTSEPEPAKTEPEGRLMFGVGVNSDAGVTGHIVNEFHGRPIGELLGLGADDGVGIGESLATWGRRAWSANEATGPPDVPEAGDNEQAWASLTEDGQPEWLRLTFDPPVNAAAIMVYESFNPGALTRITTVDSEGDEVLLWEGEDPVAAEDGKGVAIVLLHDARALTEVTLHLDSPAVPGWNEIDAVGLIDRATGEVRWADGADASSSYAEHSGQLDFIGGAQVSQCQKCHTVDNGIPGHPPQNPRLRIEQLRRELQRLEIELEHEEALKAQAEAEAQMQLDQAQQALEDWLNAASQPPQPDQGPDAAAPEDIGWEFLLDRDLMLNTDLDPARFFEQFDRNGDGKLSKDELEFLVGGSDPDEEPRQRTPYRDWVLELLNKPATGAPDEESRFEELKNTLHEQQQAIERLTNILEELRQRLDSTDNDAAGPDAGAETSDGTSPSVGPAPLAIDFASPIDELILKRWRDLGLEDTGEVADETFIRRLYLDLLGRVPTAEEIQQFQQDESPDARKKMIERLLNSGDAQTQLNENWSVFFGIQR